MRLRTIIDALCEYLHAYYNHPELAKPHCVKIEKSVTLPTGDFAEVVAVQHKHFPTHGEKPHVFMVEVFAVTPGVISIGIVQRAAQCVNALRTWYSGHEYHAHAEGFRSQHQLSIHAVCVGARLSNTPLIQSWLAPWGEMSFWTYSFSPQGIRFTIDNYGEEARLAHSDTSIRRLLDHLPWAEKE